MTTKKNTKTRKPATAKKSNAKTKTPAKKRTTAVKKVAAKKTKKGGRTTSVKKVAATENPIFALAQEKPKLSKVRAAEVLKIKREEKKEARLGHTNKAKALRKKASALLEKYKVTIAEYQAATLAHGLRVQRGSK